MGIQHTVNHLEITICFDWKSFPIEVNKSIGAKFLETKEKDEKEIENTLRGSASASTRYYFLVSGNGYEVVSAFFCGSSRTRGSETQH